MAFELRSPAFKADGRIPARHTGEGKDASPALSWTGAPKGTQSFALIVDDPDALVGAWTHWLIYDIPAGATSLAEGVARKASLPDGSKQGRSWGSARTGYERVGYHGPMPPPGQPHRYLFKLYALDRALGLPPQAEPNEVLKAMKGHILGEARLTGLSER
jgi:hypothetical protein